MFSGPTAAGRGGRVRRSRCAAIAAVVCLCGGCATAPPKPLESLLEFVVDGATTRSEVLGRLGEPAGYFANERIAVYLIGYRTAASAGFVAPVLVPSTYLPPPGLRGCFDLARCERQLILQYDEADRLVRHVLR